MKKATEELRDIAKEADKASRVGSLEDAKAMKAVKKQALDGVLAVNKIFGKVVQAAYSYDRTSKTAAEPKLYGGGYSGQSLVFSYYDLMGDAVRSPVADLTWKDGLPLKDFVQDLEKVHAKLKRMDGDVFVKVR